MCGSRTAKTRLLFPVTSQPRPCSDPLSTFARTFTDLNSRKLLYYSLCQQAGTAGNGVICIFFFFPNDRQFKAYYLTDAYRLEVQ